MLGLISLHEEGDTCQRGNAANVLHSALWYSGIVFRQIETVEFVFTRTEE